MNKSSVLIVGNGISRLSFTEQILAYEGEVWACNYAYKEFGSILNRLTGHDECLVKAQEWKDNQGDDFIIYSGPLAKNRPDWKTYTVGPKWLRDSGTTLIAQALHEGYKIEVVGFDLGGPDVYATNQGRDDKTVWINRWDEIAKEWGLENITFWGYDHKPFIMKVMEKSFLAKEYARKYKARIPHIPGKEYAEIHKGLFMDIRNKKPEEMVKVKFKNGYKNVARLSVALVLESKGDAIILKDNAEEKAKIEAEEKAKSTKRTNS